MRKRKGNFALWIRAEFALEMRKKTSWILLSMPTRRERRRAREREREKGASEKGAKGREDVDP